ncbi:hypothetical protein N7478_001238 [Penicillium angulare]|uniref:uncharacterized protein n=1 Tax=Penicillium angulare TaxID=116970 RepID=UPI0025405CB7|nr:uncharacterized protein N7478_001238 [Penicillium angulare]KAJ5291987.1 hypothetical protein N7478_001238 [Penicillium angulare]
MQPSMAARPTRPRTTSAPRESSKPSRTSPGDPRESCDPPYPPGPPGHQDPPGGSPPGEPCHPPTPSNKTIWQMISQSPQTARLADLLRKHSDIVNLLSSTSANYTIFAPTNHTLYSLGSSLELLSTENILSYHVVLGQHPFYKLRAVEHQTLATGLNESALGKRKSLNGYKKKDKDKDKKKKKHTEYPQRVRVDAVRQSVLLNGASKVVKENIMAKNGIIHYIDLPLTPPPNTSALLRSLPEESSTFTLALSRTHLESHFDTSSRHGGTTFVPTNDAFRIMGPVVNAYLFSPQGEECLRSLLRYHILPGKTVYWDVVYRDQEDMDAFSEFGLYEKDTKWRPRRYPVVRVDAQTLLEGQGINLHMMRREMVYKMRVNGFWEPRVVDVLAGDGVIHVLDRVLFPPKVAGKVKGGAAMAVDEVGVMGTLRDLLEDCRPKKELSLRMEL